MPRVTYVKKARKDNPVAKKGESYYWWKFRYGGKRYSRTYPAGSQLCTGRKSEVMSVQESLNATLGNITFNSDNPEAAFETAESACSEAADELRNLGQEYGDSADNMPESLQYGEQAEMMREMCDHLDQVADELECVGFACPDEPEDDEPQAEDFEDEDDYDDAFEEWETSRLDWQTEAEQDLSDAIDEAIGVIDDIEFQF